MGLGCSVSSTTLFTFFGRHIVEIKQMFRLQQTPPESSVKSTMSGRETEDQQRQRFQVELEFVQSFANPNYLNFLAQRGYFKDPSFINYIKYLQYWKEPVYAKYLKYPMCLHFLDLLQYEHFRKEIVSSQCSRFIEDQQLLHWQHYTRKESSSYKIKLINIFQMKLI